MTKDKQAQTAEFRVNEFIEGHEIYPEITALVDGGFVFAWQSLDRLQEDQEIYSVKARAFNADGTELKSEFLVNEYTKDYQPLPSFTGLEDGGFVITWWAEDHSEDDRLPGINVRVFNADGLEYMSECN